MPQPRVSVIVPNYNHREYLETRIRSILAQTYQDFELLLLDDASTDGSVEVLREYADRSNTRLLVNEHNSGSPFAQWNRGVREAAGEFIWIAESDDDARPELLESLVAELEAHPEVGIAQCDSLRIDADGHVAGPIERDVRREFRDRWKQNFRVEGEREIREFLFLRNTIPSASAVVFRRAAYVEAGFADERLTVSGDWQQWARMLRHCDMSYLAQPLNLTRVHPGTQRERTACDGRRELETLRVQSRIARCVPIEPGERRLAAEQAAVSWAQSVRAGRFRGNPWRHATCLRRLWSLDRGVAAGLALRLPFYLAIWCLKQTLFRHRRDAGE